MTDSRPDRVEAAAASVREEAETVRQRELSEALARLEARGSLTDEQREAVAAMTERLVARLLGPAMDGLREATAADDPGTAETVRRLFGSE